MLTNSWGLYCNLHEKRGPGTSGTTALADTLNERIESSAAWAKWAPGLCTIVGNAIRSWINESQEEREEERREGQAILKALTQKEREFQKHCEDGHMVFRRDCRACLQGQMRSHIHRRQKHQGSNTFCLTMDLVGPWRPGRDHLHGQPVTRFLIAALSVPIPGGMDIADSNEHSEGERDSAEGWQEEEYEQGVEEEPLGESEGDPSLEEFERRRRRDEEAWRRQAATLQEPVPVHDLIFCEPLTSKKSSEVLKAIQRVWEYRDWD